MRQCSALILYRRGGRGWERGENGEWRRRQRGGGREAAVVGIVCVDLLLESQACILHFACQNIFCLNIL
jgi:hypothetical protein